MGFLQIYPVGPEAEFAAATGETWGVDLPVGEVERTGQGLGPAVIQASLGRRSAPRRSAEC